MSEHGTSSRYSSGCRCVPCAKAHTARSKEYAASLPRGGETWRKISAGHLRRVKRQNAESRVTAHRNGQPWTGPELEVASRRDLSAIEAARMIGRTRKAVINVRHRLSKADPAKSFLLDGSGPVASR